MLTLKVRLILISTGSGDPKFVKLAEVKPG